MDYTQALFIVNYKYILMAMSPVILVFMLLDVPIEAAIGSVVVCAGALILIMTSAQSLDARRSKLMVLLKFVVFGIAFIVGFIAIAVYVYNNTLGTVFLVGLSLLSVWLFYSEVLGLILLYFEERDDALAHYTRVIRLDPRNFRAYFQRMWLYLAKGDTEAALQDCDAMLRLEPKNPFIMARKADIYLYQNRYADAIDHATRAISHFPRLRRVPWYRDGDPKLEKERLRIIEVYYTRAYAYFLSQQYAQATADYQAILALEDTRMSHSISFTGAKIGLALIDDAQGKTANAVKTWLALAMEDARFRDKEWLASWFLPAAMPAVAQLLVKVNNAHP